MNSILKSRAMRILSLLALGFLWGMQAGAAAPCDPNESAFVCNQINAEDLVRLEGTPWVVASHINFEFAPPFNGRFGPIDAINVKTRAAQRLYPTERSVVDWERDTYPECEKPPQTFSSHGLTATTLGRNKFRLYVANHGERQSVEIIDVAVRGKRLATTWRGCIRVPNGVMPNGIATLSNGGVVVSGFGVAAWRPGKGWSPTKEIKGSNGVAISRDGRWMLIADVREKSIHRIPVDGGGEMQSLQLNFLPDNLRWGENGKLYATGPHFPAGFALSECFKGSICDVGFAVAEIDPDTFTAKEIIRSDGVKGVFGAATTALQVGDRFWIGSSRGDRIAILKSTP